MRYLNLLWLRYYYFRFLNTDDRHVGILLPVSVMTYLSPYAHHSVYRRTKFHRNQTIGGGVTTSYRFFMTPAVHHVGFVCGNARTFTKCNYWSQLRSQLSTRSDFGDIAVFRLQRFGLKLPIHVHFRSGVGRWRIFPQMTSLTALPGNW